MHYFFFKIDLANVAASKQSHIKNTNTLIYLFCFEGIIFLKQKFVLHKTNMLSFTKFRTDKQHSRESIYYIYYLLYISVLLLLEKETNVTHGWTRINLPVWPSLYIND